MDFDLGSDAAALRQRLRELIADNLPPINVTLDPSAPCRTNPLGSKGCGESGAIGAPPCVVHGVLDALAPLGITALNTPLTPEKVWRAIQDARASQAAA